MGNMARIITPNKRDAMYHLGNSFPPPNHAASAGIARWNAQQSGRANNPRLLQRLVYVGDDVLPLPHMMGAVFQCGHQFNTNRRAINTQGM